ncbi:hypothetical protein [Amycolatopsis sp. CA-128772]|nr:hypothetical protein [Amycolatopsis sp. CA-128772]
MSSCFATALAVVSPSTVSTRRLPRSSKRSHTAGPVMNASTSPAMWS